MADDAAFIEAVRIQAPATTRGVAAAVGCTDRAADYRLRKLYADGALETVRVGGLLRWLPARRDHDGTGPRSVSGPAGRPDR